MTGGRVEDGAATALVVASGAFTGTGVLVEDLADAAGHVGSHRAVTAAAITDIALARTVYTADHVGVWCIEFLCQHSQGALTLTVGQFVGFLKALQGVVAVTMDASTWWGWWRCWDGDRRRGEGRWTVWGAGTEEGLRGVW